MREQKEKGQAPVSDHSRCFSDKGGTVKLFAMKSHGDKIPASIYSSFTANTANRYWIPGIVRIKQKITAPSVSLSATGSRAFPSWVT